MVRSDGSSPRLLHPGEGPGRGQGLNAVGLWRREARADLERPPPGPRQACAPLYSWRTEKEPLSDPVGTCYLSTDNFTRILEYAPCRSGRAGGGTDAASPPSSPPQLAFLTTPWSGAAPSRVPVAPRPLTRGPSVLGSSPPPSPPTHRLQLGRGTGLLPRGLQRGVHQGEGAVGGAGLRAAASRGASTTRGPCSSPTDRTCGPGWARELLLAR